MDASKDCTVIHTVVRINTSNYREQRIARFLLGILGDDDYDDEIIRYLHIAFIGVGIPDYGIWNMEYGYFDAWMLRIWELELLDSIFRTQYTINDSPLLSALLIVTGLLNAYWRYLPVLIPNGSLYNPRTCWSDGVSLISLAVLRPLRSFVTLAISSHVYAF